MTPNPSSIPAERLDSWKEIATFLGRGERTVKRWEVDRGLPVHRVPGVGRSAVFAYRSELTEWLSGQKAVEEEVLEPELTVHRSQDLLPQVRESPGKRGGFIPVRVAVIFIVIGLGVWGASRFRSLRTQAASKHHATDPEAQDLYLKGRYFWNRRTPADLKAAVDYFTQAIVKDPGDAQAYVGLADCYNLLREFGAMSASEAYPRALAAAQRAVELDPKSPEAHESLAFTTFWWTWKAATAEREFKRALHLNPNLAQAHHWYATYLMALHRNDEALLEFEAAQRLEPGSSAILADKGYLLWCLGRHEEALAQLKQLETAVPSLSSTYYYLGLIDWQMGAYPEAIADWKRLAEQRQDKAGLAIAEAGAKGLESGGLAALLRNQLPLQKQLADRAEGSAYQVAYTYAALGEKQKSLNYLQIAFDRREAGVLTEDPPIPGLQNDPINRNLKAQMASLLAQ